MKRTNTKQIAACFALMAYLLIVLAAVFGTEVAARADGSLAEKFEQTNVLDDLEGSTIDGESFNAAEYKITLGKDTSVLSLVEFCYATNPSLQGDWGLYIYVYNPEKYQFENNTGLNTAQLSFGDAENYHKYPLKFLNASLRDGYEGLFFKYKVIFTAEQKAEILRALDPNERVYRMGEIELLHHGEQNAQAVTVARTYYYTGYVQGYGSATGDLNSRSEELKTIELELNSTTYRFPYINENGAGHQNQLDSVYFAIPKEVNETYGELYRVKCCWDEQKTSPVIVTNNDEVYTWASKWVGQRENITDKFGIFDNFSSSPEIPGLSFLTSPPTCIADWGFGYQYRNFYDEGHSADETNGWVGSVGGVIVKDDTAPGYVFKSDKSDVKDTDITSAQMKEWIYAHDKADYLFSDSVDEGRTKGYQEHIFTADEPFDMLTFNQTASGWDKFYMNWQAFWSGDKWDFGPEQQDPVDPIRLINDNDFTGTDVTDANKLYVHTEDFDEFESFYDANKSTKNVFLLRFAVTDYYSNLQTVLTGATWYDPSTWQTGTKDNTSTYMARETVFLNFDVIELTFLNDTGETVIPVAASPIDVVGGITAPIVQESGCSAERIVKILLILLVAIAAFYLVSWIVNKVMKKSVDSVKSNKHKRE